MNGLAASPTTRLVAAALAACLLLSGCSGADTRLRRARHDLDAGMTRGEVLRKLGKPSLVVADGGPGERWEYRYYDWSGQLARTTLKVLVTVVAVASFVVVVGAIACLCSKGRGSGADFFGEFLGALGRGSSHSAGCSGRSEDSENSYRSLWIRFGDDGRIAELRSR